MQKNRPFAVALAAAALAILTPQIAHSDTAATQATSPQASNEVDACGTFGKHACVLRRNRCDAGLRETPFGYCAPNRPVTISEAIAGGCRTRAEIDSILLSALGSNLGRLTRERVERFRRERTSDGWATTLDVTDSETWAYRGSNYPDEAVELTTNSRLRSKAQRRQRKRPDPDFYSDHGPKVFARATRNNVDLTLQMIATSSSDVPASQYVSIALTEAVASVFGDVIYKFQINPGSPVLGMRNCVEGDSGEIQIQVLENTPIRNLHRKVKANGFWEAYRGGRWVRVD